MNRKDAEIKAELGHAWLSAHALLPDGWVLEVVIGRFGDPVFVTAAAIGPSRGRGRAAFFEMAHDKTGNPTTALWRLVDALRRRPEESHVTRANPPSPLRAAGAPSEGARLG
jgi:hypothetical protein